MCGRSPSAAVEQTMTRRRRWPAPLNRAMILHKAGRGLLGQTSPEEALRRNLDQIEGRLQALCKLFDVNRADPELFCRLFWRLARQVIPGFNFAAEVRGRGRGPEYTVWDMQRLIVEVAGRRYSSGKRKAPLKTVCHSVIETVEPFKSRAKGRPRYADTVARLYKEQVKGMTDARVIEYVELLKRLPDRRTT